jgi:cytochrome c
MCLSPSADIFTMVGARFCASKRRRWTKRLARKVAVASFVRGVIIGAATGEGMRRAGQCVISGLLLAIVSAPLSGVAGEAAAGRAVFNRCKICHTLDAGDHNTVGPNLHGLYGRKAGTSKGFAYSAALADSGIIWDDKTLAMYLRNPREAIPGNNMAFPGIKDDKELADLLAYLHEATK